MNLVSSFGIYLIIICGGKCFECINYRAEEKSRNADYTCMSTLVKLSQSDSDNADKITTKKENNKI